MARFFQNRSRSLSLSPWVPPPSWSPSPGHRHRSPLHRSQRPRDHRRDRPHRQRIQHRPPAQEGLLALRRVPLRGPAVPQHHPRPGHAGLATHRQGGALPLAPGFNQGPGRVEGGRRSLPNKPMIPCRTNPGKNSAANLRGKVLQLAQRLNCLCVIHD